MALGLATAVGLEGLSGYLVQVEAYLGSGLPAFVMVGLPDAAVSEARDRVRAALSNARCALPSRRITVNLSPGDKHKLGTGFDLAVAVALLVACERLPPAAAEWVHLAELGLDGSVRPIRGVLPAVAALVGAGRNRVVVASANACEASLIPGCQVVGVSHLRELIALHTGVAVEESADPGLFRVEAAVPAPSRSAPQLDLMDVVGQPAARSAVEVAAAGGHHLFMLGPPGSGKTMLAERLPGLLPDLSDSAAVEVTAAHSMAGLFDPGGGLMRRPPFEEPHHTCTKAALIGGGNGVPRPGSVSRANHGVLFLDEATEFARDTLDALRQPLESGELTIHRSKGQALFPARFQLVMAANPCPCGRFTGKGLDCTCSALTRSRYFRKLSGPLLDRIDIQVEMAAVSRADLLLAGPGESSAEVAARVAQARQVQQDRLRGSRFRTNSEVSGKYLRTELRLPARVTRSADRCLDRQVLTMRGMDRVLRLSWTLADLAGRLSPTADDVDRALVMRQSIRNAA